MKSRIIIVVLGVLLLAGGAAFYWLRRTGERVDMPADDEAWFVDVTDEVRLDFVHDAGVLGTYQMPQMIGSGAAVFDFDGDGRLDLYLLSNGGPGSSSTNRLYKNMKDGTFKDVTAGSGLGFAGHNMGVAVGDVNNDGLPDVLVTQVGGVKLLLNQGDGTFKDVTEAAGLKNPGWGMSASFFDFNRDGWLDLVLVNYVEYVPARACTSPSGEREYCPPGLFPRGVTRLFRNLGRAAGQPTDAVSFQDVTVSAGLAKAPGAGMGVCCADFDGDGWPDILVANDGHANHLWINQKDGTFAEHALLCGLGLTGAGEPQGNMGVAIGDVDNDGMFDVYITHLVKEHNTLWLQGPKRGHFQDRTARAGLLASRWRGTGFGAVMGDFDRDGWLDVAVVNGAIERGTMTPNVALGDHLRDYSERNQLFRNTGAGKFTDVSERNRPFCGTPNVARGLVCADIDGDGALDLIVTTIAGRARAFRNVARQPGHWLLVRAVDPVLKRDAYGAEITVRAGQQRWLRIVNPGDSYLCSDDPRAHFGLGSAQRYDAIEVRWPDGLTEIFDAGDADRNLVLRRGEGKKENDDRAKKPLKT